MRTGSHRVVARGDAVKRLNVVARNRGDVLGEHVVDVLCVVLAHFLLEDRADVAQTVVLVVEEDGRLRHVEGVSHSLGLCSHVLERWLGGVRQSAVLSDAAANNLGRLSGDDAPSTAVPRLLGKDGEGVELLVQLAPDLAAVDGLVGTSRGAEERSVRLQQLTAGVGVAHRGPSPVVVPLHVVDCSHVVSCHDSFLHDFCLSEAQASKTLPARR